MDGSNASVTDADAALVALVTGDAHVSYKDAVLADAPLGYWRLGELAGPTAADLGPNRLAGLYKPQVTLGALGALFDDTDTGITAAGGEEAVTFGDVLGFANTAPFSLEAWVNPTLIDDLYRGICGKKSTEGHGYSFWVNRDAGLGFGRYAGSTSTQVTGPALELGVFSHVVATFDGTMMRLYLNGSLVGVSASNIDLAVTTTGFAIGAKGNGTGDFFAGTIDEVAVYGSAVAPERIAAHFAAGRKR